MTRVTMHNLEAVLLNLCNVFEIFRSEILETTVQ
jgi:hypothetical protein